MAAISNLTAVLLGFVTYWLYLNGGIREDLALVALTSIMLAFTATQLLSVRKVHPERWLLNPAVTGSALMFIVGYGVTNLVMLLPIEQQDLIGRDDEVSPDMVKLVALALLAAAAMWTGYWSPLATSATVSQAAICSRARLLSNSTEVRPFVVPALVLTSVIARALQVHFGVFGYSNTPHHMTEFAHLSQYLYLGGELGKLALVVVALHHYWANPGARGRATLYGLLSLEVVLGILSGFKSTVVLPFLIVALCHYLVRGTFNKAWMLAALVALPSAYAVVEPFRAARDLDGHFANTSVVMIARTAVDSARSAPEREPQPASLLVSVASRLNFTYPGSFGVQYADEDRFTDQDPALLTNLLLTPAHAWVPRALWPTKPTGADGLWYYQVVMGRPHSSSAAMGPVTFLYCVGGIAGVVLGFFLIGVIQRLVFFWLTPWSSMAGSLVYLGVLPTIVIGERSIDGAIVHLLRNIPLLLLLQFLLLSRGHLSPDRSSVASRS